MSRFPAVFTGRLNRTATVESFRFLPDGKPAFRPGQFLRVLFNPSMPEDKTLNKYLSLSCSPSREYMEVTKRLSDSEFSRRLRKLKPGNRVEFEGPLGNCFFQESYTDTAFLVGGIGITPVISILEHIAEKRLDTRVTLFYSNRSEDEIAFRQELDAWQAENPNIRVFYTITAGKPADPRHLCGHIDRDMVRRNLSRVGDHVFFIFGPPDMTRAMGELCSDIGCPRENTRIESFVGY